jgi:Flp pilus assembly protein TadG
MTAHSRSFLSTFRRDKTGTTAVIFSLALMPIMTALGTAVDYARAANARASLQNALDATALLLGKEAPLLTETELNQKATLYFTRMFNRDDVVNITVTPTYVKSGESTLTIAAKGDFPLVILPVVGINSLPIQSSSTSSWGNTRLRIALALDNTGSMASANKMTALKTASHKLLTQLQSFAVNTGDVYVSIIPFSKDVNAGSSNYNASWLRWDLWEEVNGTCSNTFYKKKSTCEAASKVWTAKAHNTWNGCITDRDQSYDTTAAAPVAGTPSTLFPTEQYAQCPTSMMALTYDFSSMHSKIDAMIPVGLTNQTVGLQWAFQSLVANSPLAVPPLTPGYQYQQAIVLLTDGLNTQNRWSSSQSTIDARTKIACDNVKAQNILIYTVQVNTDGDPTSTMLKNCASDASKFFLLTDPNQIVTTFDQIATSLSTLRLAK